MPIDDVIEMVSLPVKAEVSSATSSAKLGIAWVPESSIGHVRPVAGSVPGVTMPAGGRFPGVGIQVDPVFQPLQEVQLKAASFPRVAAGPGRVLANRRRAARRGTIAGCPLEGVAGKGRKCAVSRGNRSPFEIRKSPKRAGGSLDARPTDENRSARSDCGAPLVARDDRMPRIFIRHPIAVFTDAAQPLRRALP